MDVRRQLRQVYFHLLAGYVRQSKMVALPNHKEAHETAGKVRSEWVMEIIGKVNKRPEKWCKQKRGTRRGGRAEITEVKY